MPNKINTITEEVSLSESLVVVDKRIKARVDASLPEVVKDTNWKAFIDILAEQLSSIKSTSDISQVYDIDKVADDYLPSIAKLYNINYPKTYKIEHLRLLLKVFPLLRKMRGEAKAINLLFKVLEKSEVDLYSSESLPNDVIINYDSSGMYQVLYTSNIQDTKFAKYALGKVARSGIGFKLLPSSILDSETIIIDHTVVKSPYDMQTFTDKEINKYDTYNKFLTDTGEPYFFEVWYNRELLGTDE